MYLKFLYFSLHLLLWVYLLQKSFCFYKIFFLQNNLIRKNHKIYQFLLHYLNYSHQLVKFKIHLLLLHLLSSNHLIVNLILTHLHLNHLPPNFLFSLIIVLQYRIQMLAHVIIIYLNLMICCSNNLSFLSSRSSLLGLQKLCQVRHNLL